MEQRRFSGLNTRPEDEKETSPQALALSAETPREFCLVENQQERPPKGLALIVEDEIINQMRMERLLRKCGISCCVATDGHDAINAYLDNTYDLIFMDCRMPVLDGYTAVHRIRALEQYAEKPTPIIATTGTGNESDCKEAGMDYYLSKPVLLDNLQEIIEKVLAC